MAAATSPHEYAHASPELTDPSPLSVHQVAPLRAARRGDRLDLSSRLLAERLRRRWPRRVLRPPCPYSQPEDRRLQALAVRLARHVEQVLGHLRRSLDTA